MDFEKCVLCGAPVPEGQQICQDCLRRYGEAAAGQQEAAEELRDIADVLSITANTDSNIKRAMEALLRIADRLTGDGGNDKEGRKTGI